jgi:hypothetical protein
MPSETGQPGASVAWEQQPISGLLRRRAGLFADLAVARGGVKCKRYFMEPFGKTLIIAGLAIAALGAMLWVFGGVPFIGQLPGDISTRRGNVTFYFPVVTCILISIIVSVILALMRR